MKIVSSLHGTTAHTYYGVKSPNIIHAGESKPRPCGVWIPFKISEKMHWTDVVSLVANGRIVPELPERFKCRVVRFMRVQVGGEFVDAKPGEIVEVQGSIEIARSIAYRFLRPLDPGVWAPNRLYSTGRLGEIMEGEKKSDFIKLPNMKVDPSIEPQRGSVCITQDLKVYKKQ